MCGFHLTAPATKRGYIIQYIVSLRFAINAAKPQPPQINEDRFLEVFPVGFGAVDADTGTLPADQSGPLGNDGVNVPYLGEGTDIWYGLAGWRSFGPNPTPATSTSGVQTVFGTCGFYPGVTKQMLKDLHFTEGGHPMPGFSLSVTSDANASDIINRQLPAEENKQWVHPFKPWPVPRRALYAAWSDSTALGKNLPTFVVFVFTNP